MNSVGSAGKAKLSRSPELVLREGKQVELACVLTTSTAFFYRGCSCNTKPESFSRFWPNPVGLPKLWKHLRVSKSQWILSDGTWWVLDQGSASLEAGKPTRLFCSRHRLSFSLPTPHQKHGEKISPGWKNISIIPYSSSLCSGTLSGLRDLLAD